MQQPTPHPEDRIIIAGVGLIGGSVAAAARKRLPGCRIIGLGRSEARLQRAQQAGLLDEWALAPRPDLFSGRCIVVVCLPVDMISDLVTSVAGMAGGDCLLTDAGSVKASICNQVSTCSTAAKLFVGAHPIAGSDKGGFEHAEEDLFEGRPCVVVDSDADSDRIDRTISFWNSLGCTVTQMSPAQHDQLLAVTSHLPHVLAAVSASCVNADELNYTGTGFRDATRIAAGSPSLWRHILTGNREQIIDAIDKAESVLSEYRQALDQQNDQQVEQLLQIAAERRRLLSDD